MDCNALPEIRFEERVLAVECLNLCQRLSLNKKATADHGFVVVSQQRPGNHDGYGRVGKTGAVRLIMRQAFFDGTVMIKAVDYKMQRIAP